MINVLLGLLKSDAVNFANNFRFDVDGNRIRTDLAPEAYDPRYMVVNLSVGNAWKVDRDNNEDIIVISVLVTEEENAQGKLKAIEYLRNKFPSRFRVIGAWKFDGYQHGLDSEGVGTPTYPVHPRVLKVMPDDVSYDEDGNELSRTDAIAFKQVNLFLGQKDRVVS